VQILRPKRLTPASFGPFGEVLFFDQERNWPVNNGRALRSNTVARFDYSSSDSKPVLAVYRSRAEILPVRLNTFERHPISSQAFMALSVERFLIVVAPQDPENLPDLRRAEAFVGYRGEGINYARNVWHAPISAIDADGDFLMFMWESGGPSDCIFHHPNEPVLIEELVSSEK
jgi:ureidoglycolate lyase